MNALSDPTAVVVASAIALAEKVPDPKLRPETLALHKGESVDLDDVTLLGDLAVSDRQLADPGLAYVAEEDRAAIAATRQRLLQGFAENGRTVAFAHLGLGRIARAGDGFAFEPLD
jgi:hypothetical protein